MLRACLLSLALIPANLGLANLVFAEETAVPPAAFVPPPAPGELVDIGGRRLHLHCKGDAAGPAVIFEAGLSQYTARSGFSKVQDAVAPFARACTYDRAGLGWSDPVSGPRTQQDMVADLHALIAAKQLRTPLVIVGHSVGGLLARLYAREYPEEVAGLVLVDASPEPYLFTPAAARFRAGLAAEIDAGLKKAQGDGPVVPLPADVEPDIVIAFLPRVLATVKQEYEALDRVPAAMQQARGYGTLGDLPLAVIRRGKTETPPSAEDLQWREWQEDLAALSTRGVMVVAENTGHVIPYENPAVVVDAVRRILEQTPDDASKR